MTIRKEIHCDKCGDGDVFISERELKYTDITQWTWDKETKKKDYCPKCSN